MGTWLRTYSRVRDRAASRLTSDALIADAPKEEKKAAAGGGGMDEMY